MKLQSLASEESFVLLGPGYGTGRFTLLTGLHEGRGVPRLVYAPFESPGAGARVLVADAVVEVDLDLDGCAPLTTAELPAEALRFGIGTIREHIAGGNVYQVCLTARVPLHAEDGAALLTHMCARDIPRFCCWARLPWGEEFVSASPELFFEIRGRRVHSEPMKGTSPVADAGSLESSEKEKAELAMITDLVRNDLTPVCEPRTVQVPCARRTIELAYAVQTVSDVSGLLIAGATELDVLNALHPGGSVTGAPKQAALEMIRVLEPDARGAYCGALGFVTAEKATFSLLIRTALRRHGEWVYGVGSGIVYDSDADAELEELQVKLGALQCPTLC